MERVFDYALDASDVITSIGDDWLRFAADNGAAHLTREAVVGHCLWEFIAGEPTRELYGALFRRVREQRSTIVLPFRCDSPDEFRFMQLDIAPGMGPSLRLHGRLLREQVRPHLKLLDRLVKRSSDPLAICSVCLRVQILDSQWVEAEEAIERLDLFSSAELPPLDYRVCAECVALTRGLGTDAPVSAA